MKKILLIMPYGSVGGMERLALNFYSKYKEQGFEVKAIKIIQLPSDIITFNEDEIALSKVDFNQMSFISRLLFYVKIPFVIRKVVKKYDITHSISFGDMANVFSSLSFTKEYKIASIHALKSVEFVNKNFLATVFKLAFKTSYYFFDKVVCISEAIKKDLIQNCGYAFSRNLTVIYNPHDVQEINRLSMIEIDLEDEMKLFQNNKVVLFLGRLSCQKAPWHLIKSFSLVVGEEKNLKLVLIGDGDENVTSYLTQLVATLDLTESVVFLGRKSNPYHYLKSATVLALSSYYEGTPNVIVEAIATETPIVSSNCTDGIMELMSIHQQATSSDLIITESGVVTPNFFKGSLAIPHNNDFTHEEKLFAKALSLVLQDSTFKENLITNQEQLLSKFDLDRIASSYLKPL
ncbi:glycosyltransferase [Flavobacterium lacus]|uniref:Glycosyltransferase involved in cell wall biosynthesis n=1 Tax=Flavobacterium lacus TaxID=1353778 RepID=A0A328X3L1_9FLAO|nr:glycosyltransferase [Flavobacterium lacus]RAR51137.1 glycosyltransferase involved in cell wall biosynthesis [Flavobacterium lacus]